MNIYHFYSDTCSSVFLNKCRFDVKWAQYKRVCLFISVVVQTPLTSWSRRWSSSSSTQRRTNRSGEKNRWRSLKRCERCVCDQQIINNEHRWSYSVIDQFCSKTWSVFQDYYKALEDADEKVQLANQIYDLVSHRWTDDVYTEWCVHCT